MGQLLFWRQQQKLTLKDAAKAADVSVQSWSKAEHGIALQEVPARKISLYTGIRIRRKG
jgi:transcriptional regulator with XRE-family HTH domain